MSGSLLGGGSKAERAPVSKTRGLKKKYPVFGAWRVWGVGCEGSQGEIKLERWFGAKLGSHAKKYTLYP